MASLTSITPTSPWLPEMVSVAAKTSETDDCITIELTNPKGFAYHPGQFNMLYMFGKGEVPISISGTNPKTHGVLHTIRKVGQITAALCDMSPGDPLGMRGPFGTAWPLEEAKGHPLLIIAGGIGLAPVRPLIDYAFTHPEQFNSTTVLIGCRTPKDFLFVNDIVRWKQSGSLRIYETVDHAGGNWQGHVGMVTSMWNMLPAISRDTIAVTCGPEIMMRYVIKDLLGFGVPAENVYLSMERNMKCAIGLCGHCLHGPHFVCRDGPVFRFDRVQKLLPVREL